MTARDRVYQAAALLLRDNEGAPNRAALDMFNRTYQQARLEKASVQLAGELAMRQALGR